MCDLNELTIRDVVLWVKLGCTEQEKFSLQRVSFDLKFKFITPPAGLQTDQLQDVYCYNEAVEIIKDILNSREFNLIENVAYAIYSGIKLDLEKKGFLNKVRFSVRFNKLSAPVSNIHGPISYAYSENY